jgi:signal recognition particle subunit SRP72
MAADPAVSALNSFLRGSSIHDHEEALELANAATKAADAGSSDQTTAQHTKVVALLKLDRFNDALRAIAEGGTRLESECAFEKAYALYKTGELGEAEALLKKPSTSNERALKHVAAQVAYRLERFEDAAAAYRELMEKQDGRRYGEENDMKLNLMATYAQLEWQGKGSLVPEKEKVPGREEMEVFESAYNAACGCIARGDYSKAAFLLKRARDLCEASEDLNDEDKKAELTPIVIQQIYVCTKLGKLEEAADLQKSIPLSECVPPGLLMIVYADSP